MTSAFPLCGRCGHPRELHLGDQDDEVRAHLMRDAGCLVLMTRRRRCICTGWREERPGEDKTG